LISSSQNIDDTVASSTHRSGQIRSARSDSAYRVAMVDLNNFATFPTLAVGILVASLRKAGFDVEVLSPLDHDVPAAERERQEWYGDHLHRRLRLSSNRVVRIARESSRTLRRRWTEKPHSRVIQEVVRILESDPDILLLSAYLQHFDTVKAIALHASSRGVPVLLGGPMFNQPEVAKAWIGLKGVNAIIGGESDITLPEIVQTAIEGGDLLKFEGVLLPSGISSKPAKPLRELDRVPIPDYTDFPWHRYRLPLIPIMTGRGCQWARCSFCSDVVSANGRAYRTRSVESVMNEINELSSRHQSTNFLFLDLKLNSDPRMWRAIIERIQSEVPGAQWVGTVHVDKRKDNGLSRADLLAASHAGMRRISFGLESGSQRVLDAMNKGSTVVGNSEFIRNAHQAGISVRCTMFRGFPGENANDLIQTAQFLEEHSEYIDRIRFNELAILQGTPLHRETIESHHKYTQIRIVKSDDRNSIVRYTNSSTGNKSYRRAMRRVLAAVYRINRQPVRIEARAFDGVM